MTGSRARQHAEYEHTETYYPSTRASTRRASRRNEKPQSQVRVIGGIDYTVALVVIILVLVGVVMVFSASYMNTANRARFGHDPYFFLRRNIWWAAAGLATMAGLANVSYELIRPFAKVIYVVAVAMLLGVIAFGVASGGAQRWLDLPVIGQFQPSEVARAAVIFMVASMVEKSPNALKSWQGLFVFSGVVAFAVALIAYPGGMTASLITAFIGFGMIFVASPHFWRFALLGGGAVAAVGTYLFRQYQVFIGGDGAFRGGRVMAWLDPFTDPLDAGFQTIQSLYAIASGGLFGLGIGQSRQSSFIPEPQNDMIFSIIVEELGLVGAGVILILFGMLIWRGIIIALNAPDTFSSMTAIGIVFAVAFPTIINIAVVTNTIPNTGVNLPFISYGGTSLLVTMALMGILLNISRYSKQG